MSRILYENADGGLSILMPTGEISVEETARKDVPAGKPYIIVEDDVVPTDRSFRDAWETDFSNPTGYGIGHDAWLAEQPVEEEDSGPVRVPEE